MLPSFKTWKVKQSIAACIIALGGLGFGTGLSWTATSLLKLEEDLGDNLSTSEKSWIASLLTIGALVTAPISGLYLKPFGRKQSLQFFTTVGILGWILLGNGTKSIYILFGRFVIGLSVGGYTVVVPMYIGEIASSENRGLLGSLFLVMLCIGKLFSNAVGIIYSASTASLLCCVPLILYAALLSFIPESPASLVAQGKLKEAHKSLEWYETRDFPLCFKATITETIDSAKIIARINQLEQSSNRPESFNPSTLSSIKKFFATRELYAPTLIVFTEMLLAQFCGVNISTFFTLEIFQSSQYQIVTSNQATLLIAIVQTIGCLPCSLFVDKYGRKMLIVTSCLVMSSAMFILAVFFYLEKHAPEFLEGFPALSLLPIFSLIVYNLAYSWGIGSVIWIIMSELLPALISDEAAAIANVIFWSSAFFVVNSFKMFQDVVPMYSWFMFFSVVSFCGVGFNWFLLPETKGLSPQQIQHIFEPSASRDDACVENVEYGASND